MQAGDAGLELRLARHTVDLEGAMRLRYTVFVEELDGDGELVDHEARFEKDALAPFFDHLILVDPKRSVDARDHVVGVYRLMTEEAAEKAGKFYSADEYDLSPLQSSGKRLMELGRSCVHPDYRGSAALLLLWQGLGAYVTDRDIEVMFGVASFHGTDLEALRHPLAWLHHNHLAPEHLRPRAVETAFAPMDVLHKDQIDRAEALRMLPPLLKSYLRLGGTVGEGAFVDHAFNTTDVMLVMDTQTLTQRQRALYAGEPVTLS